MYTQYRSVYLYSSLVKYISLPHGLTP